MLYVEMVIDVLVIAKKEESPNRRSGLLSHL